MQPNPQNMSQVSPVDGHSPRGLINGAEAMKALKRGMAAGGMAYAATIVAIEMLASFGEWYTGPGRDIMAGIVGMAVMYLRARTAARRMLDEGEKLDDDD